MRLTCAATKKCGGSRSQPANSEHPQHHVAIVVEDCLKTWWQMLPPARVKRAWCCCALLAFTWSARARRIEEGDSGGAVNRGVANGWWKQRGIAVDVIGRRALCLRITVVGLNPCLTRLLCLPVSQRLSHTHAQHTFYLSIYLSGQLPCKENLLPSH